MTMGPNDINKTINAAQTGVYPAAGRVAITGYAPKVIVTKNPPKPPVWKRVLKFLREWLLKPAWGVAVAETIKWGLGFFRKARSAGTCTSLTRY